MFRSKPKYEGKQMITYYTEYPTGRFKAKDDIEALRTSKALVVYRESFTEDGTPFIMLRDDYVEPRN